MTIGEWLGTRTPAPPPALDALVRQALGPSLDRDARFVHDEALAAAARVLAPLLRVGCRDRSQAETLLAVDALVTYAFEMASDDPDHVPDLASAAMRRLAALTEIVDAAPGRPGLPREDGLDVERRS